MAHQVSSYALDAWVAPTQPGTPVHDASTGEVVATVGGCELDFRAMVEHAKTVGGPALRAMTFHERAAALKALGKYLSTQLDTLYADYATCGATPIDARVDVEGGIAVLAVLGSKTLKELPNDTWYAEGSPEKIGDDNLGQVVYTSPHGVAVQINAFNFPAWAMMAKMATMVLAGMPVIIKPATATAQLAEVTFRQIIESQLLPPGSLQFVSGGIGDLFDHLDGQDYISFTGSAATAAKLRAHPRLLAEGVRFNAEADSLNATVLGPDVDADSPLLKAFVKMILREMTSKAGQKCTAIRRVFVPEASLELAAEALRAALGKVVVGDPRVEGTTMGPLVNADQRDDVASAVREILGSGAEIVVGGPDAELQITGGDRERGGFFAPTLLQATDRRAGAVHTVEAFGPVSTLVPYGSPEELAQLINLGAGSLVASVASGDSGFVRELLGSIAPYHGRLLVLDEVNMATAAPHGAVLPQLIHGGPGRAGGGEELGGIRAILHLMQATSLVASPQMLVDLTQTWNVWAPAPASQTHPFRLYLEDLKLGDTLYTGSRLVTLEDIEHFAHFTGDTFYAHMNEEAAKASPLFRGRVAHGYFLIACAAGLFVDPDPGPVLANYGLENLRFVKPVYPGETITVQLTAKHKNVRPGGQMGEVTWAVAITNEKEELCATYELLTMNACRPVPPQE